jgi:hypothetical protein
MGVVPEAIVCLKKGKTIAFSQDKPCNAARHGNHPDPVLHAFREAFREVMRIELHRVELPEIKVYDTIHP